MSRFSRYNPYYLYVLALLLLGIAVRGMLNETEKRSIEESFNNGFDAGMAKGILVEAQRHPREA